MKTLPAVVIISALLGVGQARGDEVKVLGQAVWPARLEGEKSDKGPRLRAVRGDGELLDALGLPGDSRSQLQIERMLTDAFQVKSVDFGKRMLLLVDPGKEKEPDGTAVEITKVETDKDGKTMRVHWKLRQPQKNTVKGQRQAMTVLLLERFDGKVVLQPAEK